MNKTLQDETNTLALATRLNRPHADATGTIAPPIYQSSLFGFESFQDFEDTVSGNSNHPIYTRVSNETVTAFETLMADAENGEAAVAFSSGMAAISSTLLAFLKPGDRVVCIEHVYPDSFRLFEKMLRPFGVETSYHSIEEMENNPDLMAGAKLAYLESPNSMMMQAMDLPKVAAHARNHGAITVIDNSWATPVFQRPIELGIDIVLHSASKYISGHSDVVAGVVIASAEHIAAIRTMSLTLLGGKLAPFEAWLLTRGLRTLPIRMQAHQATANLFVEKLTAHPMIRAVHSPAAGSVPGLEGRSGLLSVEIAPEGDIRTLVDSLKLFRLGVSWGGFESLVVPTAISLKQKDPTNSLQAFKVSDRIIRLSLGLEDANDLWADFEQGLAACRSNR
ncbi:MULTISPECIES: aminotransferase class I/II-fold pyridoxal phosphate-dependent enzyme [Cohaesibacter]|uniref:aminotransferase class I/II-fold pyridoxal phosphate-dependent enzyme n=1 Tax=Cohaesibacter TaxID=655352 RepID=UPI000DEA8855|nr:MULTISPECIES: aminotransferase class I/II-fold pyridoxal phosphate-dependent enzyme [Cohaesibacter]TLP48409.1 aminotransferase class I/II-fold pyridoxal phosphate-dependent enzyme [Cohaesibacter sp. CAU 1516]